MNVITSFPTIVAIIPAAGIGSRMQLTLPKQYVTINHHTVIEHTLYRLLRHTVIEKIIVVLNNNDQHFSKLPIATHPRIITTLGGKDRAHSVLAGLALTKDDDWVLVHDAARPCFRYDDLDRLITTVLQQQQGGILATPVSDTIKFAQQNGEKIEKTIDRTQLWQALTPQFFPAALLRACMTQALNDQVTVTDEASAIEYCGYHPLLVAGHKDNIKITHKEDIILAQFYLSHSEDQLCE